MTKPDPRLDVSCKNLRNAFNQHLKASGELPSSSLSSLLLLCYAVECGLKERYLSKKGKDSTKGQDFGHDLIKLLDSFPAPKTLSAGLTDLQSLRPERTLSPKRYHEAFRYGANLRKDSAQCIQKGLMQVVEWLRGNQR